MTPVTYNKQQIVNWLGAHTVAKAKGYVKAVAGLNWLKNTLLGEVQGTRQRPYMVEVTFYQASGKLWIDSECSCPMVSSCKHVAALLISGLNAQDVADVADGPAVGGPVLEWLEGFRARQMPKAIVSNRASRVQQVLVYGLSRFERGELGEVHLAKARRTGDGSTFMVQDNWWNVDSALLKPPKFLAEEDLPILHALWLDRRDGRYMLHGERGARVLEQMLATGRCVTDVISDDAVAVRLGVERPGHIEWQLSQNGRIRPVLLTDLPTAIVLPTEPGWYVDAEGGEAGPVRMPGSASRLADYLTMPSISLDEAPLVQAVLSDVAPELPPPPNNGAARIEVIDVDPLPVLTLDTLPIDASYFGDYRPAERGAVLNFATLSFDYAGVHIEDGNDAALFNAPDGAFIQVKRRLASEKRRRQELQHAGMEKIPLGKVYGPKTFPKHMLGIAVPEAWARFMGEDLASLRANGWQVKMSPEFSFNVTEIDVIDGTFIEAGSGWFDVEMGVVLGDRTVRLEPLLADLFRRERRWLNGHVDAIPDDEVILLKTDRGERLSIRAGRLKPVVRVLIDLLDSLDAGPLRISTHDVGRFEALDETGRWQFRGDASIRRLAQSLRDSQGLREAPIPEGLRASLRSYQHQGLSWLQFLREQNLSGVLADDMGLGKTVQTLAHILSEKEAGRLDRPALIVVPTTLVHNWCEETARFAPGLSLISLHGPQRKEGFERIGQYDVVVTTYPLVWRDQEALVRHDYHLLILDEAQYVKNAKSKAAIAVRELRARHRLCLTGTPLENHLGELWTQFDFLLPGFLGSLKDFTKRWRTPIEKNGDGVRRDLLARRIRPFMLRRRKDEVATELPAKTVIVRSVELQGGQRDLYETLRSAMQEKVRHTIAKQGLARSHIVVLDALLKLRQVCCAPALVKSREAARIKESAKLDLLGDMLPELVEEGRRVLLFSQFTGMLDIIADMLDKIGIAYVVLTGETTDRITPVRRFTQGEVPLFLISLKAGGVGLNLTAADTVIHYDPWWNPAVENQATDRAHRLGQDKPVFVYKLIAAGSVEEKILALQERKAALARSILSEDGVEAAKFSNDDLDALFAPMPDFPTHG